MSRKVINIDKNVYDALKKHCEQEGYKIAKFVERIISDKVGYVDINLQKLRKKI